MPSIHTSHAIITPNVYYHYTLHMPSWQSLYAIIKPLYAIITPLSYHHYTPSYAIIMHIIITHLVWHPLRWRKPNCIFTLRWLSWNDVILVNIRFINSFTRKDPVGIPRYVRLRGLPLFSIVINHTFTFLIQDLLNEIEKLVIEFDKKVSHFEKV